MIFFEQLQMDFDFYWKLKARKITPDQGEHSIFQIVSAFGRIHT